ncbi:MAG: ABC transporter substrate-binding protein [Candidatus Saccharicenans sp.]|uniref:ABC transporter substrate-binding protein n=1 Tax=Candidatus Saccharicenans sp. TaxID=2819258 RepID=UPI0040494B06
MSPVSEAVSPARLFSLFGIALLILLLATIPADGQTREFRDDLGHLVRLPSCPRRIISLAPNLTEILFALGLNQEIIGVTRYCDYPEEARSKEVVGGLVDLNLEKIRSLSPELVLGFRGNPKRVVDRLYRDRLPVYVFDTGRTFDDLFNLILRIGQLTCRQEQAAGLVSELRRQVENIEKDLPQERPGKRVFLTLFGQGSGLWTCGADSYLSHLLERARAENAAGRLKGNWLVYSREKLIRDNPDLILVLGRSQQDFDRARAWFKSQPAFEKIQAVAREKFFFLQEDRFSRFSPRLVQAYRQLVETIYPELRVGEK